jgi:hypothetical protein
MISFFSKYYIKEENPKIRGDMLKEKEEGIEPVDIYVCSK